MELNDLVNLMTVDIYQRLLTAVELGKWPDGVKLLCFGRLDIIMMLSI